MIIGFGFVLFRGFVNFDNYKIGDYVVFVFVEIRVDFVIVELFVVCIDGFER